MKTTERPRRRLGPALTVTVLCILAYGLASGTAYADCAGTACQSTRIDRIYVREDPTVLISTIDDETKLSCQPVEDKYIELRASHPKYDEIYSMLLAAKLADHRVWIRVKSSTGPCAILYAVLY